MIEPDVLFVSIPIEEFERLHAEPKRLLVELEQLRDLVGKQQREIQRLRRALSHS